MPVENDRMARCSTPLVHRTLAEIAAVYPGATSVFRRYDLDFHCEGDLTLANSALRKGLPIEEVASDLEALLQYPEAGPPTEPIELIDHIVSSFHCAHRRQLPELIRLSRRVEAVHRNHRQVPAGLADILEDLQQDLYEHMMKEELILFPAMRERASELINIAARRLHREHDEHSSRVALIEEMCRWGTAPQDACPTWVALYAGIQKLCADLREHIRLENELLFPVFVPELGARAA